MFLQVKSPEKLKQFSVFQISDVTMSFSSPSKAVKEEVVTEDDSHQLKGNRFYDSHDVTEIP